MSGVAAFSSIHDGDAGRPIFHSQMSSAILDFD
jgi:hypothetical protein